MTCPHPDSHCLDCEAQAYQDGADWVDEGACTCGCERIAVWEASEPGGGTVRCLGCDKEVEAER
jgi:hypothetical protein